MMGLEEVGEALDYCKSGFRRVLLVWIEGYPHSQVGRKEKDLIAETLDKNTRLKGYRIDYQVEGFTTVEYIKGLLCGSVAEVYLSKIVTFSYGAAY